MKALIQDYKMLNDSIVTVSKTRGGQYETKTTWPDGVETHTYETKPQEAVRPILFDQEMRRREAA